MFEGRKRVRMRLPCPEIWSSAQEGAILHRMSVSFRNESPIPSFGRLMHSIVQPTEKGPFLHSALGPISLNDERRNVTQGVPRATTVVCTEGRTVAYTRT